MPAIAVVIIVAAVRNMKKGGVVGFAMLGAVLGAVLGFLFRPSVPFVGQLPLDVVLTRGASLNGVDLVLGSTAEQSDQLTIKLVIAQIKSSVPIHMMLTAIASIAEDRE